jgi:outer membrane biosynthesis protein TonB
VQDYRKIIFDKIRSTSIASKTDDKLLKGEVEISFILNSDGTLKNEPKVVFSSNQDLNNMAVECIKSALPFPPFPASLNKEEESFEISLAYE